MKIRDQHARLNGEENNIEEFPNGIEILDDNGKSLFDISLLDDGSIIINGGEYCKVQGRILQDSFTIQPEAYNSVRLKKNVK